jgi:hypothetical protein
MQILDQDIPPPAPKTPIIGYLSAIGFVGGGLACAVILYGRWISRSSLNAEGAPDAQQLSEGIELLIYGQAAGAFLLALAYVLQRFAYSRYSFSPVWMWWLMLVVSLLALLTGAFAFSLLTLVCGLLIMVHLLVERESYQT